jgi:hypothetical protein
MDDNWFNLWHIVGGFIIFLISLAIFRKKDKARRIVYSFLVVFILGDAWELVIDQWGLLKNVRYLYDSRGFDWADIKRDMIGGIICGVLALFHI